MTLTLIISALILAYGVTLFLIPPIVKIANQKQLFDMPDQRKKHDNPIPALGGIGFFVSFWLVTFGMGELAFLAEIRYLLIGSILLLMVGIQDDLIGTKSTTKFIWQIGIGCILYYAGFRIEGFYGLFGWGEIPTVVSFFLTIITTAFIINAFNLIDGINGLAGSLGLTGAVGFGILFWQHGLLEWAFMAAVLVGVLLGFLKYNFGKADIFMGDNGSMFLGLIMSAFFMKYINITPPNSEISPLLIALSLIIIPVFDLMRVFTYRILKGQSPFTADRSHIHHILQEMGKSHAWVVRVLLTINLLVILLINSYLTDKTLLISLLFITTLLLGFIGLVRFSQNLTAIKKMETERHWIGMWE
jgi:UDP-N-acetylmuramyl pentapeptide phosphotransferase/UDP-N-acetylglucosamine-1-phosphate transferase